MFDDDTFTDISNLPRVEEIARGLGELGMTWSCNAKANVPYETLKVMKDNGLRLLLVGYESGDDQILHNIKKGLRTDIARRFTDDCRKLGILIHGTFILGLPGETTETIEKTIAVRQGNQSAYHPGVARRALSRAPTLYKQAVENGWLQENKAVNLVNDQGVQLAPISYPHLSTEEIFHGVEMFYKRFYFRPAQDLGDRRARCWRSWEMMKRRLREGVEFFRFLRAHEA